MLPSEQDVIAEVLQIYKEYTSLWDRKNPHYFNKEVRKKAYETMFEVYKTVYTKHTMLDFKKRLENMRTGRARERRKVEESRRNGENPVYTPSLWYYELFNFLDDDQANLDYTDQDADNTFVYEGKAEYLESEDDYEPEEKKPKFVVMKESRRAEHDPLERSSNGQQFSFSRRAGKREECLAFGRMVGLQLQELDSLQRTVAEKLISDVIFYARLNKLTSQTTLDNVSSD